MRVNSIADLPANVRVKVAEQIIKQKAAKKSRESSGKKSKYRNIKTEINGIKFDSKREAKRYQELMVLMNSGAISDLRLQEDITLQEAYTKPSGERVRAIRYRADFTYLRDGERVVEDTKGFRTDTYKIKKKMAEAKGIEIKEI